METQISILTDPHILDQYCPFRQALDLITDKWTPLVVYLLSFGPKRYTHLKRQIGGITQKMLTQTLKKLEAEGLATRTVYPTSPPAVEYALTPLGEELSIPIYSLFQWARSSGMQMNSIRQSVEHNQQKEAQSEQ